MIDKENKVTEDEKQQVTNKRPFTTLDIVALALCLLLALFIWIYAVNTNRTDTEKTIVFTINAEKQINDETGMSIIRGNDTTDYSQIRVELTVEGSSAALERYKDSDYFVSLDLSDIDTAGNKYWLSFTYKLPGDDISFKSISPSYLSKAVLIDKLIEREIEISAQCVEGGPSMGEIVALTPSEKTVTISGPESRINSISRVVANVSLVSGPSKSANILSNSFDLYDKNGYPFTNDNNYIEVTPSVVNVYVQINYKNKIMPLNVRYDYEYESSEDAKKYEYLCNAKFADDNSDVAIIMSGDSNGFYKDRSDQLIEFLYIVPGSFVNGMDTMTVETSLNNIILSLKESNNEFKRSLEMLEINTDLSRKVTITITKIPIDTEPIAQDYQP